MKKSNILAHRGYWTDPKNKNTLSALRAALEAGFGIETDIRDALGQLIISHDPPKSEDAVKLESFLNLVLATNSAGRIALNIKADGLCAELKSLLMQKFQETKEFYAFDMSVPDSLLYKKSNFPFYARVSEFETDLTLSFEAEGVWVDNFSGNFEQIEFSKKILRMGRRVAFVSPELHQRSYAVVWDKIKHEGLHLEPCFELCTDFPCEAWEFFSGEK